jgi:hypothetical protein
MKYIQHTVQICDVLMLILKWITQRQLQFAIK